MPRPLEKRGEGDFLLLTKGGSFGVLEAFYDHKGARILLSSTGRERRENRTHWILKKRDHFVDLCLTKGQGSLVRQGRVREGRKLETASLAHGLEGEKKERSRRCIFLHKKRA